MSVKKIGLSEKCDVLFRVEYTENKDGGCVTD
jgi:hypothetical protein